MLICDVTDSVGPIYLFVCSLQVAGMINVGCGILGYALSHCGSLLNHPLHYSLVCLRDAGHVTAFVRTAATRNFKFHLNETLQLYVLSSLSIGQSASPLCLCAAAV